MYTHTYIPRALAAEGWAARGRLPGAHRRSAIVMCIIISITISIIVNISITIIIIVVIVSISIISSSRITVCLSALLL